VIYDEQIEATDDTGFVRIIKEGDIKVVGVTAMTLVIHRAMEIAEKVKRVSKDVKVVIGGVHPTVMPEECLKNENIDIVVRQEGEITLWEYIRSLRGEMNLKDIHGLSYKDNGIIIHNPDRPLIKDLDSLPPCLMSWKDYQESFLLTHLKAGLQKSL
jgi:radical SAM superfamily enzyme YgiQ (UPF0313 family)